jgi:methionyl-tRNA formyltransferase
MKIIFFGIPDLGLMCLNALLERKKDIVAIVTPVSTHPTYNLMAGIASYNNIPIIEFNHSPNEPEFIELFKSFSPDIAIVCAFDHKIPDVLLKIPPLGFINCHPSLLPQYRGGNPYFHVIANGEKKTGVTIHYMDKGFDTGDIILQHEVDIMPDETFGTIFSRLNLKSAEMIADVADKFEKQGKLSGVPQNQAEEYKKAPIIYPDKDDCLIDWTKDAKIIERFIRACNPIYGATSYYRNCAVKIWSAKYTDQSSKHSAGTIAKVTGDDIFIAAKNGMIMPTTIQIGFFMITDVKDFIKRFNPQVGEDFS